MHPRGFIPRRQIIRPSGVLHPVQEMQPLGLVTKVISGKVLINAREKGRSTQEAHPVQEMQPQSFLNKVITYSVVISVRARGRYPR